MDFQRKVAAVGPRYPSAERISSTFAVELSAAKFLLVDLRLSERGKKRFAKLRKRGVGKDLSAQTAGNVHCPWRINRSPALSSAFPNAHFNTLGLALLARQGTA